MPTTILKCIILWRRTEDFPEVFEAWDVFDADDANPQGFDDKIEQAKQ